MQARDGALARRAAGTAPNGAFGATALTPLLPDRPPGVRSPSAGGRSLPHYFGPLTVGLDPRRRKS